MPSLHSSCIFSKGFWRPEITRRGNKKSTLWLWILWNPAGSRLTDVVEGAAGGWRHLKEAWVDERSEGGGGLVFLHIVTRLALKWERTRLRADEILQLPMWSKTALNTDNKQTIIDETVRSNKQANWGNHWMYVWHANTTGIQSEGKITILRKKAKIMVEGKTYGGQKEQ